MTGQSAPAFAAAGTWRELGNGRREVEVKLAEARRDFGAWLDRPVTIDGASFLLAGIAYNGASSGYAGEVVALIVRGVDSLGA